MEYEATQSKMAGVEEPESSPRLLAYDDGLLRWAVGLDSDIGEVLYQTEGTSWYCH